MMLFHDLGPIRQVGYVVRDIHAAMENWVKVLGIGPFFFFERAPVCDLRYCGIRSEAALSVAFANSGPLQIELVQPLDEHPSCFNDFRRAGLEGQQHVAFWTTDLDSWVARCEAAGVEVVQSGYTGAPDCRFVYVNTRGHPGTTVEISEVRGKKAAFFEHVATISAAWDGSDPVRRLSNL